MQPLPGHDAEHGGVRGPRDTVRASERLRDVVQMTRPDGAARLAPLGRDDLDALVRGAKRAGMAVTAEIDPAVLRDAPAMTADLAARTVREGLTNAARHSPGSAVRVDVGRHADDLEIEVRSAPVPSHTPPARGGGHGITDLRRRAELLGGSLDAGTRSDGTFVLALRAPLHVSAPRRQPSLAEDPALRSSARTTRRRVLQTALVPLTIVALVVAGFVVVEVVTQQRTSLSSAVYDGIALGTSRADLAGTLPEGIPTPAPVVSEPPAPANSQCEYFAAREGCLHFTEETYRLCFDDGVLVEKSVLGDS